MKKNLRSQTGMTLIELTVVLLILIGLAGLLIPYVSGFMAKTHNSTTVSTIADLNRTIGTYQSTKWILPTKLDSLVNASGTTGTTNSSGVNGGNGGAIYGFLQYPSLLSTTPVASPSTALAAANASLAAAGVTFTYGMNPATSDATFNATTGNPVAISSATTTPLAFLNPGSTNDGKLQSYGLLTNASTTDYVLNQLVYGFGGDNTTWDTTCTNYVVMGIGSTNSMVPGAMASAPVHFAGTGPQAPALAYDRYVAVYAVPAGQTYTASNPPVNSVTGAPCYTTSSNAATFVGAAMIMPFPGLVGLNGAEQYVNSAINN